jgi:DNA repair protein SbcC/Rad50
MLTPTRLTVRGFRGFSGEQTFEFLSPATIFSGENHCGKSSTLNALEWCLFGDQCKGKETNIRERVGWIIPNRHLERPDVLVELRLTDSDGEYVVRRRLQQPAKKRTPVEDLELECPHGDVVNGASAEQLLAHWLRSSFRDFSTTVYQHQESIRGIVTQEPRERNDAIDRLLGLSDYRNLLSGIAGADPKGRQKSIGKKFEAFEERVKTAVTLVQQQLEEGRREAEVAGVPRTRLTEKTALEIASQVMQHLQQFVEEVGLKPQSLALPARWQDLQSFEKAVQAQISKLRASLPDQKEQTDLHQRQTAVTDRISDYENLKEQQDEIGKKVRELDTKHGGQQTVIHRMMKIDESLEELKSKQKEVSGRHQVLVEAVAYLEAGEAGQANCCPVCESETKDLLPTLRKKVEKTLGGKLDKIQETIASLQAERSILEKAGREYGKSDKELADLLEDKQKLAQKVGRLLGHEPTQEDDPVALLKAEQSRVTRRLKKLEELINARQERLTQIEGELEKERCVREVLQQAEKKQIIEKIKESQEYRELNEERDRLAVFVNDVEAIKWAVSEASHEEAGHKLKAARAAIDKYFRQLTRNPAVKEIVLELKEDTRSGRNVYNITTQDGQDLTPILSQGDLNALALAIFLGLASAGGPTAPLGFVMLDDPSQSMGAEHKGNLAAVLDEVCKTRQLLLATMDGEFFDCLDKALTRAKTVYLFEDWTPSKGPSVRRQ